MEGQPYDIFWELETGTLIDPDFSSGDDDARFTHFG